MYVFLLAKNYIFLAYIFLYICFHFFGGCEVLHHLPAFFAERKDFAVSVLLGN